MVDVYGVPVTCTHGTWGGHILEHHPVLSGQQRLVADALTDPDRIYDSGRRYNRKLFYREAEQPLPFNERYILVIVAYDDLPEGVAGVVVTAYPIDDFLEGDIYWYGRGE